MKMKVKCENLVRCANRDCYNNCDGYYCTRTVITIGADGKCTLFRPQIKVKSTPVSTSKLVPPLD